jgi:hypothetical protein
MAKFTLKTNVAGFNEARNSADALADLHARAQRVADAAAAAAGLGADDFVVVDSSNATRARVVVIAATEPAIAAEATDRVLTLALQAAAG